MHWQSIHPLVRQALAARTPASLCYGAWNRHRSVRVFFGAEFPRAHGHINAAVAQRECAPHVQAA
jgi:hypothetical protein